MAESKKPSTMKHGHTRYGHIGLRQGLRCTGNAEDLVNVARAHRSQKVSPVRLNVILLRLSVA